MLIPAKIIVDTILEDRADIPINAIHMHSGLKADLYPVQEGDELRLSAFQRRGQVDYGPPIGKVYNHSPEDPILYKLIYFGLSQQSKHYIFVTTTEITLYEIKVTIDTCFSKHGLIQ